MRKSIEFILRAFPHRQISDAITLVKSIREGGYDMEDVEAYILNEMQSKKDMARTQQMEQDGALAQWMEKAPKCPSCGQAMRLIEMNTNPGNMLPGVGCFWQCPDVFNCGTEIDSKLPFKTELAKIGWERPPVARMYDPAPAVETSERLETARRSRGRRGISRSRSAAIMAIRKPCG